MVADIMTTADVAVSLLHRGNFNTAIGVLTDEMLNAKTSKDRIAAAATLVKELKPSEKIEMGIDIGFNEDAQKQIDQTNQQLAQVAKNQMALLKKGYSIDQIQQIHIRKTEEEAIDADVEE
jgi:SOS response regulatory protein OraA/RecX